MDDLSFNSSDDEGDLWSSDEDDATTEGEEMNEEQLEADEPVKEAQRLEELPLKNEERANELKQEVKAEERPIQTGETKEDQPENVSESKADIPSQNLAENKDFAKQPDTSSSENRGFEHEADISGAQRKSSRVLVLIHPNEDICLEPMQRLLRWLQQGNVQKVIVATHAKTRGIDTRSFWKASDETPLGEVVMVNDYFAGKYMPVDKAKYERFVNEYMSRLQKLGQKSICLRDENVDTASSTVDQIKNLPNAEQIEYGQNPLTQNLSIFESVIGIKGDEKTFLDRQLVDLLDEFDQIYFCGDQLAVHFSVRSLSEQMDARRIYVLEDALCPNPCFHGVPRINSMQTAEL